MSDIETAVANATVEAVRAARSSGAELANFRVKLEMDFTVDVTPAGKGGRPKGSQWDHFQEFLEAFDRQAAEKGEERPTARTAIAAYRRKFGSTIHKRKVPKAADVHRIRSGQKEGE